MKIPNPHFYSILLGVMGLPRRRYKPTEKLVELCKPLDLSEDTLRKLMDIFESELKLGLGKITNAQSSLKCFVTHVQDLPKGDEQGHFLALDLAGPKFRVLVIKLSRRHFDLRAKEFTLPDEAITGTGEQLFDHIAECLFDFCSEYKITDKSLSLVFVFGFPYEQDRLNVGILKHWAKGFTCSGVEGKDVVALLNQAIDKRKDLKVEVCAVMNDTVGTLMSCAWKKTNCKIGLIIGTGTNSCYVEKVENVQMFDGDRSKPYMIINTESGAFGSQGQIEFVRTDWDRELDKECVNPGVNIHEKMISGMYLGDVVRRVLLTGVERGFVFSGQKTQALGTMDALKSEFVSEVESERVGVFKAARRVLGELGYSSPSTQDLVDLHYVCNVASTRACNMVSATMAQLLNHMGFPDVTIGVDGWLYESHPGFPNLMNRRIRKLVKDGVEFQCSLLRGGYRNSGAALVAAAAVAAERARGGGGDSLSADG